MWKITLWDKMLALLAVLLYKFCCVYMPRENWRDVKCSLVQVGVPLLLLVELHKKNPHPLETLTLDSHEINTAG